MYYFILTDKDSKPSLGNIQSKRKQMHKVYDLLFLFCVGLATWHTTCLSVTAFRRTLVLSTSYRQNGNVEEKLRREYLSATRRRVETVLIHSHSAGPRQHFAWPPPPLCCAPTKHHKRTLRPLATDRVCNETAYTRSKRRRRRKKERTTCKKNHTTGLMIARRASVQ